MKLRIYVTVTAATALLGGAAFAQQPQPPKAPTPGSVTGDWNGPHAPTDDVQYTEKVRVTAGAPPAEATASTPAPDASVTVGTPTSAEATIRAETAPAAATAAQDVNVTTTLVTNGPIPDTAENRARFGGPDSRAGKLTQPRGN